MWHLKEHTGNAECPWFSSANDGVMYCIVCKKEARPASIYCSDSCILKHAQESLSLINKEKHVPAASPTAAAQMVHNQNQVPAPSGHSEQLQHSGVASGSVGAGSSAQLPRAKPDARVIVFERKTGRLLAGMLCVCWNQWILLCTIPETSWLKIHNMETSCSYFCLPRIDYRPLASLV